jgi:sodium/hydrogen antiporter
LYLLLAFGFALLIAVYLSGLAERSPVSTSVLFVIAGFLVGPGMLNLIHLQPSDPAVGMFVKVALVTVLFTDGMEINTTNLQSVWKLSGRALILGLPLTLAIMAILGHWLADLPWGQAILLGAVLSPTDPVFASILVNQPAVPEKLRRLLNVESGLNDGLALPIILTVLAFMNQEEFHLLSWMGELMLGMVIGITVTWAAFKLRQFFKFQVAKVYQPLLALAIGILVNALSAVLHGNNFLASFSAGVIATSVAPDCSRPYLQFGKPVSELLKLGGLLIFGSLLSISFFSGITPLHFLFALLILLLARPIGLNLSLIGSSLTWKERLTAGWFGPRGFASVIYALLVYRMAPEGAGLLIRLIALVILLSIVLHSSTDALAPRIFQSKESPGELKESQSNDPDEAEPEPPNQAS